MSARGGAFFFLLRIHEAVNLMPLPSILWGNQTECRAFFTGTCRTANTVNIVFRYLGKVIIDDMFNMWNIKATCNHIRCDKNAELFRAIVTYNALTFTLFQVTVNCFCAMPVGTQLLRKLICTVFCFYENNDRAVTAC